MSLKSRPGLPVTGEPSRLMWRDRPERDETVTDVIVWTSTSLRATVRVIRGVPTTPGTDRSRQNPCIS